MPKRDKDGLSEGEFLSAYNAERYPRPSLTADIALFAASRLETDNYRKLAEPSLELLLIRRGGHPYLGKWALPGGFLHEGETLEQAACRELAEEAGVRDIYIEQLYTFSEPGRDPRGWVVTSAYLALADKNGLKLQAGDDAAQAAWFTASISEQGQGLWQLELAGAGETLHSTLAAANGVSGGQGAAKDAAGRHSLGVSTGAEAAPPVVVSSDLAFDHASIITYAIIRMRNKLEYTGLALSLLPEYFTLTEAQQVYELICGRKLLAAAFRRKIVDWVEATDSYTSNAGHRPSRLYRRKPAP